MVGRHEMDRQRSPTIKLKDLQIVLAVARSRNMGRAAADLAISQPAISKTVADLQQQLGFKLFDRNRRGVEPTIYGDAVLKSALVIFDELRQGVQALEFLRKSTWADISDAPWVLPPPEFAVSEYLMGAFEAEGIEPRASLSGRSRCPRIIICSPPVGF
jgi:hypothetical protein